MKYFWFVIRESIRQKWVRRNSKRIAMARDALKDHRLGKLSDGALIIVLDVALNKHPMLTKQLWQYGIDLAKKIEAEGPTPP